jgi:hypothetical protein
MMPAARRGRVALVVLGLLLGTVAVVAPSNAGAQTAGPPLTWFSGTYTATKNAYARPADASPSSFTSPVDYAGGRMYWRLELTSKPSSKPMLFQICMWRHTPGATDYEWETCSAEAAMPVSTAGTTYADLGVLRSWWTKSNGWDWNRRPDVVRIMIKDAETKRLMMSTVCGSYCYRGSDIDQHVPIVMNTATIIVPAGTAFSAPSGWRGCPASWGGGCSGSVTTTQPVRPPVTTQPPVTTRPPVTTQAPTTTLPPAPPAGTLTVPGGSGAPSGAEAVIANLALTDATAPGYVSADRCDRLVDTPPSVSSANHPVGAAVSNLAIVSSNAAGQFCVYRQRAVQLVADVFGYLVRGSGWTVTPVASRRALDTRSTGRVDANSITRVPTGLTGRPAALVNIALVGAASAGYVTAGSCDQLTVGPQARSTGNAVPGQAVSNLAVVPLSADGAFCIYSQSSLDLVVDVQAAIGPDASGLRWTLGSQRLLDTRTGGAPSAGTITRVATGLPAGTPAAVVNVALTDASAPGYVVVGPCSTMPATGHTTSNANHTTGPASSNLALVTLDADGGFCLYRQAAVHAVVDLQASLTTGGALGVSLANPSRLLDTRAG